MIFTTQNKNEIEKKSMNKIIIYFKTQLYVPFVMDVISW